MKLYASELFTGSRWLQNVTLGINDRGFIDEITPNGTPDGAQTLAGPVIPGMINLHSHAFQRAFAGFSELKIAGRDSFWSWRKVMYDFVARITPEQAGVIAHQLYIEMLKAGYTHVGEFHYLHHDPEGKPYADRAEMSHRVIAAAESAGLAITHLPVLYRYGGFKQQPPEDGQKRFLHEAQDFGLLLEGLFNTYKGRDTVRIGMAPHSLRAVSARLLKEAIGLLDGFDERAPIHIHISEQIKEVMDCKAATGRRPVAWLLDHVNLNDRWCLVHATHVDGQERNALALSKAVAGLCPTTEANLGDGLFPALDYLIDGGAIGIGSDSHISVSPIEELRLLEYGQRLLHRERAVLCDEANAHVGANLYARCLAGGAQAMGRACGSLEPGHAADLLVLNEHTPSLLGKRGHFMLDAFVFAGNVNPVRDVMVQGQWRVQNGRHEQQDEVLQRFIKVQSQAVN